MWLMLFIYRHAIEVALRVIQSIFWHGVGLTMKLILEQEFKSPESVNKYNEKLQILHYTFWGCCGINIICLIYIQTLSDFAIDGDSKTSKYLYIKTTLKNELTNLFFDLGRQIKHNTSSSE